MLRGPASMEGATKQPPSFFPGGWWRDGYAMRPLSASRWALMHELGPRAYRCLVIEERRMFPPGLQDLEDLREKGNQ